MKSKLQIREGGYYRRRDGQIVGPARKTRTEKNWPWIVGGQFYTTGGHYTYSGDENPFDLIEEVFFSGPITDEEVVRRFNELNKAGKLETKHVLNDLWTQSLGAWEYRLALPKPKTVNILGREVTEEELRALKKALEEA